MRKYQLVKRYKAFFVLVLLTGCLPVRDPFPVHLVSPAELPPHVSPPYLNVEMVVDSDHLYDLPELILLNARILIHASPGSRPNKLHLLLDLQRPTICLSSQLTS